MNWVFWISLSALFAAISLIFKKKALIHEHSTEFLTTFKFFEIITLILFIPYMNFNISFNMIILLFLSSLVLTFSLILTAKSYKRLDISIASPLTNLSPAFTIIFAFIFLKETLSFYQLTGVFLLIFGAYFLELSHHDIGFFNNIKSIISQKYVQYLIYSLIIGALVDVSHKYFISNIDPLTLLFLSYLFTFFSSFVISSIFYGGYKDLIHGIKNAGKLIFADSVFATLSNITYYFALNQTMISLVMPVKKISTLLTVILGGKIFHEHNLVHRSIACLIMLVGIALMAL
ncbi:DMT family transporter [archaeon]|nr:DMT family transporter [archaeon]